MTEIIDDHAPTSPFPHSPLSFTPADIDTIGHLSGVELNEVARTTQRLARQAEARTALLAYRIGESIADDMLVVAATRPHTHHAVDKAAIAEISLQLGISRSLARRYAILGAHLTDLPHDEAQESSPGVLTEIPHPWAVSTVATFWWVRWRCAGCGCGRDGHEAGRSRRRV